MRARTSETASLEGQPTGRVVNYGRRSTYTRAICMTANFARALVGARVRVARRAVPFTP